MAQGDPCFVDATSAGELQCAVANDEAQLFQFNQLCPHGDWCFYDPAGTTLQQSDGSLVLASDPMPSTAWWDDLSDRPFGPLLYRRVDAQDFSVVTRVTVDATAGLTNQDFKVAGLLLRAGSGAPAHDGSEHFLKLEYGYVGSSAQLGINQAYGVLMAQIDEQAYDFGAHLGFLGTAGNVSSVGLGICRRANDLFFYANAAGDWEIVTVGNDQALTNFPTELSVGLMAAAYSFNGGETVGHFDYFGIRTGDAALSNCIDEIEALDAALAAGRD